MTRGKPKAQGEKMKLQQFAKVISKNFTILSIASAFALGLAGMTNIKDSLFDTSKWFMETKQTEQGEFENVAADPEKPDFDFGKTASESTTEVTTETTEPSKTETTTKQTTTEITSSEEETSVSEPDEGSDAAGSESVSADATTVESSKATKATEESTKKTKKTSETTAPTEEPSENTTKAPKETTTKETKATTTTEAPKETTTAAPETTKKETQSDSQRDTSGSYNDSMAKEVLTKVNEQRAANGLAPLSWSGSLAKGAKYRATEIVIKWDHSRPDGSDWYTAPGCEDSYGENLAKGYGSVDSAMDGWMNSAGHRANILKSDYKTLGVACYVCNGKYYWVQEFGY
jgi:uncharacterized protein YkwD